MDRKQFSKNTTSFALLLIFICFLRLSIAENQNPSIREKELAATLLAAESNEQRDKLLAEKKNQVTPGVCEALISEGNRLRETSDFSKAMKSYDLAKFIAQKIGDKVALAKSILAIGIVHSIRGSNAQAFQNYQESLAIAKEAGDKSLISAVLKSIGIYYHNLGNDGLALENFHQSLAIAEEIGDKEGIARTVNNIGVIYMFNGNYAQALEHLTKAMSLQGELQNKELAAHALSNIAVVYDLQGNYLQALDYYQKSLNLWEQIGDKAHAANVLNNMGDYRLLGSYDVALDYNKKALAIAEEIGDKQLVGKALANVGNAYLMKGDHQQAMNFTRRSLSIAQELNNLELQASQLKQLAKEYYSQGDYANALEYSESAVVASKTVDSRQTLWAALEIKGKSYRALNESGKARQAFEEAIATIEDWRSLIAGGEVEQLSLFAEKTSVYHEMIDLLITQNRIAEAFVYAERVKARVLLDVLHSGKIQIAQAMTAQELQEEKKWGKQLVELNEQIRRENQKEQPNEEIVRQLNAGLQKARLDFDSFRTKLYVTHPELKIRRGEASAIRMEEAADLMDPNTAMLEFIVTDEKTYLFVLSKESESVAARVYGIPIPQKDLIERVQAFRGLIANRDPGFQKAATELYQLLLLPAVTEISAKTKLVLAPDAILWELPFQILKSEKGRFLLEEHALSYTPSLTVYREMKRLRKASPVEERTLLAFGNPTLGKESAQQLKLIYRDEKLVPLPEAEKEVQALEKLYGSDKSQVYVREQAREDRLKQEAGSFGILHLATHGILNDMTPLYSQIVLAQGESTAKEDGLLEAWEVMNLNLKADLVLLSACNTALGRVGRGEGMIGLTWAFFIAGSPAIVVSQWKVDSASTTQLMLEFHKNLRSSDSHSKAEALRAAALKLMQTDQYRHPFYWAPFVVIGEGF